MLFNIGIVRNMLKIFLQGLEEGSYFNICSFGDKKFEKNQRFVFPTSVKNEPQNINLAMRAINTFGADLGLTDIKTPLEEVFQQIKANPNAKDIKTHHVYLITDGKDMHGNNEEIFKLVKDNCFGKDKNVRLHAFGIGNGVDEYLVKQCAAKGKGHYYFAYKDEEIMQFANLSLSKNSAQMKSLTVEKFIIKDIDGVEVKFNQKILGMEHESEIMKTPFSIPAGSVLTFSKAYFGKQVIKSYEIVWKDPN